MVATQGHGDEEAIEQAVAGRPGLRRAGRLAASAARRCSATWPTGACRSDLLDRVRVPVGLDLGHTLAPGDRRRHPGRAGPAAGRRRARARSRTPSRAGGRRRHRRIDPVCGMTVAADDTSQPARARRRHLLLLLRRLPQRLRAGPRRLPAQGGAMLIKNDFEVAQPVDKVWQFFDDIPQVAACLPGAELTEDLGDDKYQRQGRDPDGAGQAAVRRAPPRSRSATTRPSGSWSTPPAPTRRAGARPRCWSPPRWRRPAGGTKVEVAQDLQLSGAAAQYGRGHDLRRHRRPDARLRRPTCRTASTPLDRGAAPGPGRRRRAGQRLRHRRAGRVDGADAGGSAASSCPTSPTRAEEDDPWCCGGSATRSCCWSSCPSSSRCSTGCSRRWSGSAAPPTTSWPAASP